MSEAKSFLRLAYYGDDLTGSTDALEALALAGVRALLFLEPPRPADLARYPGIQAIGVAGSTRAMKTAELDATLRDAFSALHALGPCHVHYKICSTFDSSPEIGSVGRAIEVGRDIFQAAFVPVVGGAPALGRYCVFANLFARFGIGGGGQIHRLDRHPSMSRHPVTPAHESDLRRHLGRQTRQRIESFDLLQLGLPAAAARASLDRMVAEGAEVILFDALYPAHLDRIGELLDARAIGGRPFFSVGPSSVEAALGATWRKNHPESSLAFAPTTGADAPLLVASGSCSAVTEEQIAWV